MLLYQAVDNDATLAGIHDQAEKFDPRTEQVFKYLQIISAAAMSFAHGANDVANAVGPFAALYGIYQVCAAQLQGSTAVLYLLTYIWAIHSAVCACLAPPLFRVLQHTSTHMLCLWHHLWLAPFMPCTPAGYPPS